MARWKMPPTGPSSAAIWRSEAALAVVEASCVNTRTIAPDSRHRRTHSAYNRKCEVDQQTKSSPPFKSRLTGLLQLTLIISI